MDSLFRIRKSNDHFTGLTIFFYFIFFSISKLSRCRREYLTDIYFRTNEFWACTTEFIYFPGVKFHLYFY